MSGKHEDAAGVQSRFRAKLESMESSKRDLTPWGAQCLLLALKAMTTGDLALAEEKIEKSAGPPDATSS